VRGSLWWKLTRRRLRRVDIEKQVLEALLQRRYALGGLIRAHIFLDSHPNDAGAVDAKMPFQNPLYKLTGRAFCVMILIDQAREHLEADYGEILVLRDRIVNERALTNA